MKIPLPKKKERELYMTPEEWRTMLRVAYKLNWSYGLLWDLLGQSGFRITEALSLCPCDFNFDKNMVTVKTLKQKEKDGVRPTHEIQIPSALMQSYKKYFRTQNRTITDTEPIFPFKRVWAWKIFKVCCKGADLNPRYSPHALRHTHCIMVLEITKGDLVKTAKRLRQKSTNMPMHYSHLTEEINKEITEGLGQFTGKNK